MLQGAVTALDFSTQEVAACPEFELSSSSCSKFSHQKYLDFMFCDNTFKPYAAKPLITVLLEKWKVFRDLFSLGVKLYLNLFILPNRKTNL